MFKQLNRERSTREILIGTVIIGGTLFVLLYATCLLLGKCYLEYDSTFTEIYPCQESTGESLHTVTTTTEQLFLCGTIQGNTPRPGGLYLFHNDVVIMNTHFEQLPGQFIEPVSLPAKLEVGHYRIEIGYAHEILASTTFEVIGE